MNAEVIAECARDWIVRIDKGELSPEQQAALDAWLEADPRHLGAYVRAQAAWEMLSRARALSPGEQKPRPSPRRRLIAGGMAAGLALTMGLTLMAMPKTSSFSTQHGEIRRVSLDDGSVAVLDSDTALETSMSGGKRSVHIDHGLAWFEVVHDRSRPFVVDAGNAQVRALGTAFSVRRTAAGADVMVTEGVVEAKAAPAGPITKVKAGVRADIAAGGVHMAALSGAQIDRELAWRDGRIALDGVPLREAVVRFNQYNTRKLVVTDPDLGNVAVVGWFSLNAPDSFAQAVAVSLRAAVRTSNNTILIARDKKNTD